MVRNVIFFTLLYFCSIANAAQGLQVLTPPPTSTISYQSVRVVGISDEDHVDISVDGHFIGAFPVVKGYFHAALDLKYGLAHVHVEDASSTGSPIELEILVAPRNSPKHERVLEPLRFHGSDATQRCVGCHEMVSGGADGGSEITDCTPCHPRLAEGFTNHARSGNQASTATCAACHRVQPDLRILPPTNFLESNPCYQCHTDKIGEFAQEFVHGPVAGGSCTICHDPHGSTFEKSLRSPAVILCLSCHTDIDPDAGLVRHQPFENGQCVACHDPHSTANRWVLTRSSETLCFQCHGEGAEIANHDHPYNVKPRQALEVGLKLTTRGRLECVSCHNPHSGPSAHLLRSEGNNLCVGCHPGHE